MYTRHTSRVIIFWLTALPMALDSLLKSPLSVLILTAAAGFVVLGLDEISMQLEQPFRLMPMQPLSVAIMRDVADAFVLRPSRLPVEATGEGGEGGEGNGREEEEGEAFRKPAYW